MIWIAWYDWWKLELGGNGEKSLNANLSLMQLKLKYKLSCENSWKKISRLLKMATKDKTVKIVNKGSSPSLQNPSFTSHFPTNSILSICILRNFMAWTHKVAQINELNVNQRENSSERAVEISCTSNSHSRVFGSSSNEWKSWNEIFVLLLPKFLGQFLFLAEKRDFSIVFIVKCVWRMHVAFLLLSATGSVCRGFSFPSPPSLCLCMRVDLFLSGIYKHSHTTVVYLFVENNTKRI